VRGPHDAPARRLPAGVRVAVRRTCTPSGALEPPSARDTGQFPGPIPFGPKSHV